MGAQPQKLYVTGFWKTVPNYTFLFSYIYHCHTNNITYSKIFHNTTWNLMLKLLNYIRNILEILTHK